MKDGTYVSVIFQNEELAEDNFYLLSDKLPGINLVCGLPGNELLIQIEPRSEPAYPLNQIRQVIKGPARFDMFDLMTDHESGNQYRNWYYLPHRRLGHKKG